TSSGWAGSAQRAGLRGRSSSTTSSRGGRATSVREGEEPSRLPAIRHEGVQDRARGAHPGHPVLEVVAGARQGEAAAPSPPHTQSSSSPLSSFSLYMYFTLSFIRRMLGSSVRWTL